MPKQKSTSMIKPELKKLYAEKTFDLTNIGAGATLFGQFLADKDFSWRIVILGILLIGIGYSVSYWLYLGGDQL